MKISMLGHNESTELTGFSMYQLELLYKHLRMPDTLSKPNRYQFGGEEVFLHYMVYNRSGPTKLQLSKIYFGSDPRRFTYSIRLVGKYIYKTFIIKSVKIL